MKRIIFATIIISLVVASLSIYNFQYASSDGDTNFALTPTTTSGGGVSPVLSANASIDQNINGTSSITSLGACPDIPYIWAYQFNVMQSSSLNYSWIQVILAVGTNESCFTVWYWPNLVTGATPSVGYQTVTPDPGLWNSSGSTVTLEVDGLTGETTSNDSVFDFNVTGVTSSGATVTSYIYPDLMSLPNDSIQYSTASQENLGIVAPASTNYEQGVATFTKGNGTIIYLGMSAYSGSCYEPNGPTGPGGSSGFCYQTEETSNMKYGDITDNIQVFGLETQVVQTQHNSELGTTSAQISILPDFASDVLYLGIGDNEGPVSSVTWSAGTAWVNITSGSATGTVDGYSAIWGANVPSGITSPVTITVSGFSGSGAVDLFLWEVSDANTTYVGIPRVTTGNYYSDPNVTSFSTFTNGFLMGVFGDGVGCQPTITGGSGFSFLPGSWRAGAEYIVPFSGNSSTIPFGGYFQCGGGLQPTYTWVEVGITVPAN